MVSSRNLQEVDESLSLSAEAVNNVLLVVGDWSLEEEAQVGEDWAHGLVVDLHSGEEFSKDDHIDHEWSGEKGVLAHVVGVDGVDTVNEDGAGVLIKGSL